MATVRLTAFFRDDDGHGWSEAHDIDGGSSTITLSGYLTAFDTLMKTQRRPMLAFDAYYIGCRASYKTVNGTIAASNLLADVPLPGTQKLGSIDLFTDAPEVAVKLRIQNAASTANSDIYLRGIWDDVVIGGVLNFVQPVGAAWKALMIAYFAALKAGAYGWVGIDTALTSRGNVTNYIVNADGTITFTVAATNGIALPTAPKKMNVNIARLNHSDSVLNRALLVNITSPTSFTTVLPIACSDFFSAGTYIAQLKAFIPYDHIGYPKLAQRKTGRPFGVGRGRLSARPVN